MFQVIVGREEDGESYFKRVIIYMSVLHHLAKEVAKIYQHPHCSGMKGIQSEFVQDFCFFCEVG